MDIDFSLILVSLVAFCGALWLLDSFLIKQGRLEAIENYKRTQAKGRSEEEVSQALKELAQEPLVVEYAKSFFPVLLIVLILRSFLIEPFQIPTGSMVPTLQVGDFILVNKYYIKRVIGLPGDTIRYEDKNLYINGEAVSKEFVEDISVKTTIGDLPGTLFSETIGTIEHSIQYIDAAGSRRTRTNWIVPNGHYFMMGDSRDNSEDSRVWGTVSETEIVGKAIAVWMHKEPGLNLPTFSKNKRIF